MACPGMRDTLTCSARCCTRVVFPVPFSPTSSTGSCCEAATATASIERMKCPVSAKGLPCRRQPKLKCCTLHHLMGHRMSGPKLPPLDVISEVIAIQLSVKRGIVSF